MKIDSDKIIIANWFDRDDLQALVGAKINQETYNQFKSWIDDSNLCNEVSNIVYEYWIEWLHQKGGYYERKSLRD